MFCPSLGACPVGIVGILQGIDPCPELLQPGPAPPVPVLLGGAGLGAMAGEG